MSSDSVRGETHIDKGKARAAEPEPTEGTPLLGSASAPYTSRDDLDSTPRPRRLWSRLVTVFLISLSLCVLAFLLVIVVAYSYRSRASDISPDEILQHALVVKGPSRVDVLNTTGDGGVWVNVHCKLGLDAGEVAGVNTAAGDNFVQGLWKSVGRWGIRQLDRVTVDLTEIGVFPESDPSQSLTTITLPSLEIPLTANPPPDTTWLTEMIIPVLIQPTKDISVVMRFLRDSWRDSRIAVRTVVAQAFVQGGGLQDSGWRRNMQILRSDIRAVVHIQIPALPGLPPPGHNNPFPTLSELVTLQRFSITSANDTLSVDATATVVDPVPVPFAFNFTVPAMPFVISLPFVNASTVSTSVRVATVNTQPFTLTHPNVTVGINGTVLPLSTDASATVSAFLGNYISGRDSDIVLSTPLIHNLTLEAKFPAAHPKPQILRNVTIKDMKIKAIGSGMYASGIVFARVVQPRGMNVGLDVVRVFPDVLVYDGEVPDDSSVLSVGAREPAHYVEGEPPEVPLPDPLPQRAFAHIRPEDWLPSTSKPAESGDEEGSAVAVSATIVDVPLEVLPGREREFSNFVSKVIFGSQGAVAGIQGLAAVALHVQGLPFRSGRNGEMELMGLPFKGTVRIGKRSMFNDNAANMD
ncbi:hypothetical protein BKA93DRAFT_848176 [Sparassis latifolia]|uniref:Uncharacterized protein n=1 Tax=Sparassis crispa TaxID=139825 RepID=A0A401GMB6_9APHY|nr:hypothetical protein SCP_0504290 [Sparassis crispa]GBE83381.1 hypothetical protein SCP_0504290 [Sparassis crispa]